MSRTNRGKCRVRARFALLVSPPRNEYGQVRDAFTHATRGDAVSRIRRFRTIPRAQRKGGFVRDVRKIGGVFGLSPNAMKTIRLAFLSLLALAVTAVPAFARGPGGGGGSGPMQRPAGASPNVCTPIRDGSGPGCLAQRGNPKSTGTPLKDGSGKAAAPGQGAKDGTGNRANCPNPPRS